MKNRLGIEHKVRMLPVTDNWHPCYEGNTVRLRLSLNYYNGFYVRLSAWGADDFGLDLDRYADTEEEALNLYKEMENLFDSIPDGVEQDYFYNLGFEQF